MARLPARRRPRSPRVVIRKARRGDRHLKEKAAVFIGHYALGCRQAAGASAAVAGHHVPCRAFIDLIWPTLLLLASSGCGSHPPHRRDAAAPFEHYPWSHSLLAACGWGLLLRRRVFWPKGPAACGWWGLLVVSHWLWTPSFTRRTCPLLPGGSDARPGTWQSLEGTAGAGGRPRRRGAGAVPTQHPRQPTAPAAGARRLVALLLVIYLASCRAAAGKRRLIGWWASAVAAGGWGYWWTGTAGSAPHPRRRVLDRGVNGTRAAEFPQDRAASSRLHSVRVRQQTVVLHHQWTDLGTPDPLPHVLCAKAFCDAVRSHGVRVETSRAAWLPGCATHPCRNTAAP
jgi:hypothetical protein